MTDSEGGAAGASKSVSIFDVTEDMLPPRRAPYQPVTSDDRLLLDLLELDAQRPQQTTETGSGNRRDSYGIADSEHGKRRLCTRCGIQFSICPEAGFGVCIDCAEVELDMAG